LAIARQFEEYCSNKFFIMFDSKRFLVYRLEDSITTTIIDSFSYQKAIIFN